MVTAWFIWVLAANSFYGMGFATEQACNERAMLMNSKAGKTVVECRSKEIQSRAK